MPAPATSTLQVRSLLLWILIQLVALVIGAAGIPLWAHHPLPRESTAVYEMVIVQIVAVAMLFPILLPNVFTAIAVISIIWPFAHLAGFLSATPEPIVLLASFYVTMWIIGLWICNHLLRSTSHQLQAISIAQSLSIGGAILWYLHLESTTNGTKGFEFYGPVVNVCWLINGASISWIGWSNAAVLPVLAAMYRLMNRSGDRRHAPVP